MSGGNEEPGGEQGLLDSMGIGGLFGGGFSGSSSAMASGGAYGAPINFGSYSASPITGSGNTGAGMAPASGLPWYVWAAVIGGVYLIAKKRR